MADATIADLIVTNSLTLRGDDGTRFGAGFNGFATTEQRQTDNVVFPIPWGDWRKDGSSYATDLPGTSSGTDLGLYGGTFGTSQPSIRTYDVHSAGSLSLKARVAVIVPDRYVAGQTFTIRLAAGMVTTVADTACTLLVEAYRIGKDDSIGSQICPTGALSMNTLGAATKSFTITPATLNPGDVLDVRITIAVNDAATTPAVVQAAIFGADVVCDIQG